MSVSVRTRRSRGIAVLVIGIFTATAVARCGNGGAGAPVSLPATLSAADYDPLAVAYAPEHAEVVNLEASVPPMCYTKTAGVSNPCWTCHTEPVLPNQIDDAGLQEEYAFSDFGLENHWGNLFVDRAETASRIGDDEALAWIRTDNYTALRAALASHPDFPGYRPDLDFARGFDADGFAADGSGWRALRYKPFPGTFWPTNGSTDDVMIRLPWSFRVDAGHGESLAIYRANLAILEAAIAADPRRADADLVRVVEPVDETVAGMDLNGDGSVGGVVTEIRGLPPHYVGGAAGVPVHRHLHPEGTEYLHTVRYVDPDEPSLLSARMKEVRWSKKILWLDPWARNRAYEKELNEKEEGRVPVFPGGPEVGLRNAYGWQLQGFIEDDRGRLRLQTLEEHRFCMGCHGTIGVTVDSTFTLARKVPGRDGWRPQDLRGIVDAPQVGHAEPETLTYFRRVQGGDEFRANDEVIARFFPGGVLDDAEVRRAAPGGDRDLMHLLAPSRERALRLAKAYMTIVREQSFDQGRDALWRATENVHRLIENGETELGAAGLLFTDGRLWLDW